MRISTPFLPKSLLVIAAVMLVTAFNSRAASPAAQIASEKGEGTPICLNANNLSIASGTPSLVLMSNGSVQIPVWSLSGGTPGQSVAGLVGGLPRGCTAVKIEIVVTTTETPPAANLEDVYRVHLSQMVQDAPFTARYRLGDAVRTVLPAAPLHSRTILLESYYEIVPDAPLWLRIQREPADPADTFTSPTGLAMVKVTPLLDTLAKPQVVQDTGGYNSWPMLQALGDKLVCVYSRGTGHTIGEDARGVYARTSTDGGKTWTEETVVANTPAYCDVEVGKGLDATGAMLLWVRRVGKEYLHDLYRTTDGVKFTLVTTPKLDPAPMQITDIFAVPKVGLMALWFAGNYGEGPQQSWGTVTSSDDGATWTQTTVESGLTKEQWPTEPAAVYLGDGRILGIARTEMGGPSSVKAQFQLESTDYGATWTRTKTNISDVAASTPSLILDSETGLLSNYYYHRGRGILRRRVVDAASIFGHPLRWPASEAVATGSDITFDAGNANATVIGGTHYISFYSGKAPDTSVLVSALPAPSAGNPRANPSRTDGQAKSVPDHSEDPLAHYEKGDRALAAEYQSHGRDKFPMNGDYLIAISMADDDIGFRFIGVTTDGRSRVCLNIHDWAIQGQQTHQLPTDVFEKVEEISKKIAAGNEYLKESFPERRAVAIVSAKDGSRRRVLWVDKNAIKAFARLVVDSKGNYLDLAD